MSTIHFSTELLLVGQNKITLQSVCYMCYFFPAMCTFRVGRGGIAVRTHNRENPGSNRLVAVSKLGLFRSLHVASNHTAV